MNKTDTMGTLSNACKAVQKHAALQFGPFTPSPPQGRTGSPDGLIEIEHKGALRQYAVEIKSVLHSASIPLLINMVGRSDKPLLVIASYVAGAQGRALKAAGVQFMDTVGNCWLDMPGLCLLVLDNKGNVEARPIPRRSLSAVAVRLVFHYLADPSDALLNRPYREISDLAGVSLGSVTAIRASLDSMGYLDEIETGFRLANRRELMERWVTAYADRVRQELAVVRYQAPAQDWWKTVSLDPSVALWGGEVAANRLTGYLKPEIITLYRLSGLNPFILKHDLRMDPDGNVEILDAFWKSSDFRDGDCVHPIIAYADLIASGDDRNIETARMLHERHLRKFVESD